jgi:putative protease
MFLLAREICPDLPLHISTQANNTNYLTYRFWYEQGVRRVVAARELSLAELAEIRAHIPPDMEIEAFVHGAMCISYSGRCLLSNYFTGQDANQGACTHPCRWKYAVVEETRPNQYLPVDENERGTFIFNSRDLCMIEYIPELIKAGIDSFKIEGRMKSELYVATVTRAYRQALDDFLFSEETYRERMDWYRQEIRSTTYRHHATGFYFGKPGQDGQIYDEATYLTEAVYLGTVEAVVNRPYNHRLCFEQKNKFTVGEQIEIIKPSGENVVATVLAIYDEDGNPQNAAPHAKQLLAVELSERAEAGDLLRRK